MAIKQAHRTRAEDQRALHHGIMHGRDAVEHAAHRFGQRRDPEIHVADRVDRRSLHDAEPGETAVARHSVGAELLAQMRPSATAGAAVAAFEVRIDHDPVPDGQTGDALPHIRHDPGIFVAGHDRKGRRPVIGVQHLEIGVTDAARTDLDDDLARAGHRIGQISEGDFGAGGEIDGFHGQVQVGARGVFRITPQSNQMSTP